MNNKFVDPYRHVPYEDKIKVTAYISPEDAALIRGIRLVRGTTQTLVNMLLKQFVNELKQHGITDYTKRKEFEDFTVRRCASLLPVVAGDEPTNAGHDRGSTEGGNPTVKGGKVKPPIPRRSRKKGHRSSNEGEGE